MKLIDKEALLLALRKKRYSKQSLDLIESQPVVDAIPVPWLEQNAIKWGVSFTMRRLLEAWEKENESNFNR